MAITSAVCNSFKQEILVAEHNFTASSGNTFNLALYDSGADLSKSTTAYTTSEEWAAVMNIAFGTQKGVSANATGGAGFCSMRMGWLYVEVEMQNGRKKPACSIGDWC